MWFKKYSQEAHKHACRALYKALLTHSVHLPIEPQLRRSATSQIRRQFRKSRALQGRPQRKALEAGYEYESLLRRACQSDGSALTSVTTALAALLASRKARVLATTRPPWPVHTPPQPPNQLTPTRKKKMLALTLTPREKAVRSAVVRARPPRMGCTNGLPVLKRPGRKIPMWVSSIINQKVKRKVRHWDVMAHVRDNVMYYAEMEDMWDEQLARAGLVRWIPGDDATWMDGAELYRVTHQDWMHASERRSYAITERFQSVIDTETIQYHEKLRTGRVKRRNEKKNQIARQMEQRLKGLEQEWKSMKDMHGIDT
ncbi:hypothetical protein BZA05DRAFT_390141 [Tricharina praecox]|nr:uncharacterized protein BZA05DRAFT_439956 [Tricharina praecox]XP_051342165.1 uncharacterized protein BZA05DRAFT_390141 [Tricharina praecox]KAI5840372.1 hypothetical protein BZA05DRAFT_439956 [Tricharina praecox]KAI5855947.1 hypothetical protein BZA05DRAFT_390141 [Tricharina praecox]